MAGRWNFAAAFARSLENQQRIALEKEQGARQQESIDLQSKQVDQSHAHEMVMESIAKTNAERAAQQELQQTKNTERLAVASEAMEKLKRDEWTDAQRPMTRKEVISQYGADLIPAGDPTTTATRRDWLDIAKLHENDTLKRAQLAQSLAIKKYYGSLTPSDLKNEDIGKIVTQEQALNEYQAAYSGKDLTGTPAKKPMTDQNFLWKVTAGKGGYMNILNPFDKNFLSFKGTAKNAVQQYDALLQSRNQSKSGNMSDRERARFNAVANLASSGLASQTSKGSVYGQTSTDMVLGQAINDLEAKIPKQGTEEQAWLDTLKTLRNRGNADMYRAITLSGERARATKYGQETGKRQFGQENSLPTAY